MDIGEAMALGLAYSRKPGWGQRAESHSGDLKGERVPWRHLDCQRSLAVWGGGGCQATWGCARFSVHLLPFPCRLTISSRFCASAPPNSACDRLWVAMVTTGTPILYVLTIPGSTSPGCGWVFLSLNSTPSWRGVGGHLFQTINLLLHPQQRRRGQSPKGQSLGRDPKIVYYEQTKGEGTSKHPFQIIISTVF